MADDFADKFSTPVVHVRWWGSYNQNFTGNTASPGVKQFLISFEDDVAKDDPTNTTGFSHPGKPLLTQTVLQGRLWHQDQAHLPKNWFRRLLSLGPRRRKRCTNTTRN